jgi:uncharacterized protein (DUF362 family)
VSFLNSTLIILFLVSLLAGPASAQQTEKARVFYAMETSSLAQRRTPNPAVVRRMVDNLVCATTGKSNPAAAWASLVKASDRVGIKVAASGGAVSGTHPAVVKAIATGLISAGVQPSNIIVWDRNLDDLLAAGYSRNDQLYRLRWVDTATGYDKKSQVTAPVIGRLIWGDSAFGDRTGSRMEDMLGGGEQLSSTSYYAKVLSQEVDKVINVPSLTDSFLTGVNGALANMTLPNLDNWRRFTRSPDFGDPYLAEIYADAMIHGKIVVTILDALVLQYAGGPFPNPGFLVDHHSIFMSKDPVAIDATAARLLNENRTPSRLPSLDKMTLWLQSASAINLGKHREEEIELIRVGARPEPPTGFKQSAPSQPEVR